MFVADKWEDFEVISAGNGEKYERWGNVYLRRPDPQAFWPIPEEYNNEGWTNNVHAIYKRSSSGGGAWSRIKPMPQRWTISYDSLGKKMVFGIEPTSFKHTGLFPEQADNWDFCGRIIEEAKAKGRKDIKILNLFAYTGAATIATSIHGADEVVHVDASKGMILKAKENVKLSGIENNYIRFIAEDCNRFIERELRRGRKYDGIIMDPPAYGRGPSGELWKLEDSLYDLMSKCSEVLSDDPLFMICSSYASAITAKASADVMALAVASKRGGRIEAQELGLPIKDMSSLNVILPCGQTARWVPDNGL